MSEPSQLLEGLLAELEPMALEMVDRTRAEIPSFNRVPADQHLRDTRASVELLIATPSSPEPKPRQAEQLAKLGARRAAQGVPVEDLLRAWRLSITIGTDHARRLAERLGLPAQSVINLFQGALGSADEAMVPLVEGHRAAESTALGERDEFVLAALDGSLVVEALRVRGGRVRARRDPALQRPAGAERGARAGADPLAPRRAVRRRWSASSPRATAGLPA